MVTGGMIFSSKCTKKRLAAGLRSDPLGELKRSPRLPSLNKGVLLLSSDVNKDWTHKDKDKDKDQTLKDQDKDKD